MSSVQLPILVAMTPVMERRQRRAEQSGYSGPGVQREYLTPQEAADTIGTSVSWIREQMSSGRLPSCRLIPKHGAGIRVKRQDVISLLLPVERSGKA